ncbi:MAG: NFYB/HAP3 family transcription factor subunit [Candidatus Aenigmatarchaeota archaeon]
MGISLSACERIAKNAGIKRISKDALEELRDILEEYGFEIAEKASKISSHSERKTVKKKDIEFVIEKPR